jgi:hypothetical protein
VTNGFKPPVTSPPDSMDRHIERLQGEKRLRALGAKIKSMERGYLLVYVERGVARSFREPKLVADGLVIEL